MKRKNFILPKNFGIKYCYFFFYFFSKNLRKKFRRRSYKGFFYRLNASKQFSTKKIINYRYVKIRIVKFFFVFLSYKKFRRIAKIAKQKSGLFEHNYLLLLEGRLVNFLYRVGFMETLYQSLYYIKGGFIFINSKSSTFINQTVKIFDIVTFHPIIYPFIFFDYYSRLCKNLVLHPPIRCLFVSFFFLFFYFFKQPKKKDYPNKQFVDIYLLTGYPNIY